MKIYDEETKQEIQNPDLSLGYLYEGIIVTGYTEAHYEYLEGTEELNPPNGLTRYIESEPVIEKCYYYKKYTQEELEKRNSQNAALNELYNDLASSYRKGVNSV